MYIPSEFNVSKSTNQAKVDIYKERSSDAYRKGFIKYL